MRTPSRATSLSKTTPRPRPEYSVFFSHKVNDEGVTRSLIKLLSRHTENVRFSISEQITRGSPWRKSIAQQLTDAKFLVLVFTDPHANWGWCLYESGFFDALSQVSKPSSRIWCLHHAATSPPSPLADLQSIPAKTQDVEQWLRELFKETEQTKSEFIDDIPTLAEEICRLFSVDQKPLYSQRFVKIKANSALISPDDLHGDAVVEGDNQLMSEVFGTFNQKTNWHAVKEHFRTFRNSSDVNITTLKEISNAIYCVAKHAIVRPIQGIVFVAQGPKRYRPILSTAKQVTEDEIECDIMFVEEAGGHLQNIPKSSEALLTAIRMATRIRWEIVRPFAPNVRCLARADARQLRVDLQTCLNNVFLEAGFRGNFSTTDLLNAFDDSDKDKLLDIVEKWNDTYPKIWRGIGFTDTRETFGEAPDGPMTPQDVLLLRAALQELEILNRDFLSMAVARGQLLIQRELRANIGIDPDEAGASGVHQGSVG
jgi:TIR domain